MLTSVSINDTHKDGGFNPHHLFTADESVPNISLHSHWFQIIGIGICPENVISLDQCKWDDYTGCSPNWNFRGTSNFQAYKCRSTTAAVATDATETAITKIEPWVL